MELLREVEQDVKREFEAFYGKKDIPGFCEHFNNFVDLILEFLYKREVSNSVDGKFQTFEQGLRYLADHHYLASVHTLRSLYLLVSRGYYADSATLLRSNIESFVRLKYVNVAQDVALVGLALSGHKGFNGVRWRVSYETQFNKIAPGLYSYYRILCDVAHGALFSEILRSKMAPDWWRNQHPGVEFRDENSSFIVHQFCAYGVAQLYFLRVVYPEVYDSLDQAGKDRYGSTTSFCETVLNRLSSRNSGENGFVEAAILLKGT